MPGRCRGVDYCRLAYSYSRLPASDPETKPISARSVPLLRRAVPLLACCLQARAREGKKRDGRRPTMPREQAGSLEPGSSLPSSHHSGLVPRPAPPRLGASNTARPPRAPCFRFPIFHGFRETWGRDQGGHPATRQLGAQSGRAWPGRAGCWRGEWSPRVKGKAAHDGQHQQELIFHFHESDFSLIFRNNSYKVLTFHNKSPSLHLKSESKQ